MLGRERIAALGSHRVEVCLIIFCILYHSKYKTLYFVGAQTFLNGWFCHLALFFHCISSISSIFSSLPYPSKGCSEAAIPSSNTRWKAGVCLFLLNWVNKLCVIGTLVHIQSQPRREGSQAIRNIGVNEKERCCNPGVLVGFHVQMNMGKWENPIWGTEKLPQERGKKEIDSTGWLQRKFQ